MTRLERLQALLRPHMLSSGQDAKRGSLSHAEYSHGPSAARSVASQRGKERVCTDCTSMHTLVYRNGGSPLFMRVWAGGRAFYPHRMRFWAIYDRRESDERVVVSEIARLQQLTQRLTAQQTKHCW